jgi:hypothetical protein
MKKKRWILTSGAICLAFIIFGISYNISLNKFSKKQASNEEVIKNEESYATLLELNEVLSGETDIILKIKLKNTDKEFLVKNIKVSDLNNVIKDRLSLKNVEDYYNKSYYKLTSSSPKELIFVKESRFEPNKYYLGASDGYISILKCNNEGQLFLEDPLTDKSDSKVDILPEGDKELINNFEFKFDNKEEALDELASICS